MHGSSLSSGIIASQTRASFGFRRKHVELRENFDVGFDGAGVRAAFAESACSMRCTSRSSSMISVPNAIVAFSAASGSMNSVCPLELVSWTMPGSVPAYSALIGITKRPSRSVTTRS